MAVMQVLLEASCVAKLKPRARFSLLPLWEKVARTSGPRRMRSLSPRASLSVECAETTPSPQRICICHRSCPLPQGARAQQRAAVWLKWPSGRRLPQRGDDVVHDVLDQGAVVAFAHHADHRFGAGGAHEEAAVAVEALLAIGDRRLHLGILERLAALVADVLEDLRQRIEAMRSEEHTSELQS